MSTDDSNVSLSRIGRSVEIWFMSVTQSVPFSVDWIWTLSISHAFYRSVSFQNILYFMSINEGDPPPFHLSYTLFRGYLDRSQRASTNFGLEPYLKNTPTSLVYYTIKFRTRNHRLPIETGSWIRTPQNERVCLNCNSATSTIISLNVHFLITKEKISLKDIIIETLVLLSYNS